MPPMGTVAPLRRSHLSMVAQNPHVALLIYAKMHLWRVSLIVFMVLFALFAAKRFGRRASTEAQGDDTMSAKAG